MEGDCEEWCDLNDVDIEEGYYDPFQPNVGGGFVSPGDAFGTDIDTVVCCFEFCWCGALAGVRKYVGPAGLRKYG